MQAKNTLTTRVSITCGKRGPTALLAFTSQSRMFGSVAEKVVQSPASRWPWQWFCSLFAREFISYVCGPCHPAALALLLSLHCGCWAPCLSLSCRIDSEVLCNFRSTCSLALPVHGLDGTGDGTVPGDSKHSSDPLYRVFVFSQHMLLYCVSCWKSNSILEMAPFLWQVSWCGG